MTGPSHLTLANDAPQDEINIGGGALVSLPNGPQIWRLEGGGAEVYLDTDSGRTLIARIPENGCVLAQPKGVASEWIVLGEPGACLKPIAQLTATDADQWLRSVASALSPPAPDETPITLPPGGVAEQGALARAERGAVIWLEGENPAYFGLEPPSPTDLLPLAGVLVGHASKGRARAITSAELSQEGRLASALMRFSSQLPALAAALRQSADDKTIARLAEGGGIIAEDSSPVAKIASALRYNARPIPPPNSRAFSAVLTHLRRAGLRARKITLGAGWRRRDIGPLIAEHLETREAVALIWDKGAYRKDKGAAISDETAFGPFAYAVHAPLPGKVKGLMSLAIYLLPALKRDGGLALAAGAGAGLIGALTPLAAGWIFSDIVPSSLATLLFAVGAALVAGAGISTLFSAAKSLALQRIDGRTGLDTAAAVTDRILRLPPGWFHDYAAGDLNQRITAIDELRQLVTGVMLSAGLTLVFSLFYFATLLSFDAALAGLAFGLVMIYVAATFMARALQMRHVRRAAELDGKVSGASYETLAAVGKLRVAAAEERALSRWTRLYAQERRAGVAMGRIGVHFGAFADAYQTITLMTLFGVAAVLTAQDTPAGLFIGFLIAFGSFQGAFTGFCDGLMSLFTAAPLAERAKPIFTAKPENDADRGDPGRLTGAMEISGLSFSYPGARTLLDGLDVVIEPGEHIAIVGGSGSGKSTILRLLLGFEAPDRGTISYDDKDLARLGLDLVRRQIGVVMQASQLYAGSIFENIRGASDAGLEDCLAAAEAAGLGPDLAGFPMGLHTPITEGAGALSGGQRQRVLIARALASHPSILFFDEATSALDNVTQGTVMQSLDRSSATRITIAHRLSTVRRADRICVLEGGKFVEIGGYDDLMAAGGVFAALAQRQLLEA